MIDQLTTVLNQTISTYLDALGQDKTELQNFISALQPSITEQLTKAAAGDKFAGGNLSDIEAQIAGKAIEIGWQLDQQATVGLQQIIATGVGVAIKILVGL